MWSSRGVSAQRLLSCIQRIGERLAIATQAVPHIAPVRRKSMESAAWQVESSSLCLANRISDAAEW
jgi:hypothetical protein